MRLGESSRKQKFIVLLEKFFPKKRKKSPGDENEENIELYILEVRWEREAIPAGIFEEKKRREEGFYLNLNLKSGEMKFLFSLGGIFQT